MEERKRPATNEDGDSAPPLKRQATSKEGKVGKGQDADLPGKDDLERFKKEAIYRQLLEYKREKQTLENRLSEINKSASYHDDHLRAIDAWLEQLVDEIRLMSTNGLPTKPYSSFPSSLFTSDIEMFQKHLSSRSEALSSSIKALLAQDGVAKTEASELQAHLARLLAQEKDHINEVDKVRQERDQLLSRLETATSRYMMAEKKLDRAKSATVAKLEQQAIASARPEASNPNEGSSSPTQMNGVSVDTEALGRAEEARLQAEAASAKHKDQIDQLAAENESLTSQLTALSAKQTSRSDDEYASTDLFKHLKLQHAEVIKRVNDLEATNIQLRKEAERLQAERSAHKNQLETEQQAAMSDRDLQLSKVEADLARVRLARDELHSKVQTYEANEGQERASIEQFKQFISAKDERIKGLEAEIERLSVEGSAASSIESVSEEELRQKHSNLEKQYNMLMQEMQGAGLAYKKLQSTISTKINNQLELEEKVKRATGDKNKSDQKYFAAMKAKEVLSQELRVLRAQSIKSTDLIAQLRDADQSSKALVTNLETELAKTKDMVEQLVKENSKAQADLSGQMGSATILRGQVEELKAQLNTKDSALAEARSLKRKAEMEVEELRVSVQERDKRIEATKKNKGGSTDNETLEMLRTLAMCTVCSKNFKNTAIKTCGHTMCNDCVEERITSRSRKCPHCNKPFGRDDYMKITLN